MKILNGIAYNLNWNLIQLNSYWDLIQNSKLILNWIEKKRDANWCKRFWNFSLDYGVQKNNLNRKKNEKIPFHAFVFGSQLIRFQSFGRLMESKAT
jgi:hypothetical protein